MAAFRLNELNDCLWSPKSLLAVDDETSAQCPQSGRLNLNAETLLANPSFEYLHRRMAVEECSVIPGELKTHSTYQKTHVKKTLHTLAQRTPPHRKEGRGGGQSLTDAKYEPFVSTGLRPQT
ncbi:hypothetical protein TNCV_3433681 [Trichonephila clavipes]|nr:hypothetical protein TNCV_3433681 [Trichonephila clavipes]